MPATDPIADVPWAQPCGYDPQVADDPASLRPSGGSLLRRAGPPICSTTAAARRTRCAPIRRPRTGFIEFLGRYRGEPIAPPALTGIAAADLRAFLADRRGGGLGASSSARELSGVRAFLKYAAEQQGSPRSFRVPAPPTAAHTAAPAAPDDAVELAENAARRRAHPGSGLATLRSCCCSTAPGFGSPKRCRSPPTCCRSARRSR